MVGEDAVRAAEQQGAEQAATSVAVHRDHDVDVIEERVHRPRAADEFGQGIEGHEPATLGDGRQQVLGDPGCSKGVKKLHTPNLQQYFFAGIECGCLFLSSQFSFFGKCIATGIGDEIFC